MGCCGIGIFVISTTVLGYQHLQNIIGNPGGHCHDLMLPYSQMTGSLRPFQLLSFFRTLQAWQVVPNFNWGTPFNLREHRRDCSKSSKIIIPFGNGVIPAGEWSGGLRSRPCSFETYLFEKSVEISHRSRAS